VAFEPSYRRHLATELRKAVLEILASKLDGDATVGEIVDAAAALGWGEGVGELTLGDLADALLPADGDGGAAASARGTAKPSIEDDDDDEEAEDDVDEDDEADEDDEDEDDEDDEDEDDEPPAKPRAKAAKGRAKATAKTKAKPAAKAGKGRAAKAEPPAKAKGKPAKGKPTISLDERMSLQEAAKALLPLVQGFGQATMQQLESATRAGRRKLRFHIGQLVRHGYLERHGMGRGTYYTAK
jgi:hypothetical protein